MTQQVGRRLLLSLLPLRLVADLGNALAKGVRITTQVKGVSRLSIDTSYLILCDRCYLVTDTVVSQIQEGLEGVSVSPTVRSPTMGLSLWIDWDIEFIHVRFSTHLHRSVFIV